MDWILRYKKTYPFLPLLLRFYGYHTSSFNGYSFRIGAATAAALRGESNACIRAAGYPMSFENIFI